MPTQPNVKLFYAKEAGHLTLQDHAGYAISFLHNKKTHLFKQMPVRSGQAGYLNAPWVNSKGAIPLTSQVGTKKLYLHLAPIVDKDGTFDLNGIGLFFPISDSVERTDIIRGNNSKENRWVIGLHPENKWVGSAGCIVLLWNNKPRKAKVEALFAWLLMQAKAGVKNIELEVV
jgi:hypothetical protein